MSDAQRQLDKLRAALAASGDLVYEWDFVADRIEWLDGADVAFGALAAASVARGKSYNDRIHPDDLRIRRAALTRAIDLEDDYDCEYRVRGAKGEHIWYHDRGTVDFASDGSPIRLCGVLRPLRDKLAAGAQADQLANCDPLTGHFNRARLREALEQALDYAHRYEVDGAYMVVGIDKLTLVNQAFGHEIADQVIVAIGERLDRCLRSSDVIGRVGGDCFGAVLAQCPPDEVARAAEKILEMARNTVVETPAGPIHVTVSIGVATFPDTVGTPPEAMTKADVALRTAKDRGRDCYVQYSCSEEQMVDQRKSMVVAEQVQQALRDDRVRFAFQPVVDSQTLAPRFHECLLRMVQPNGEIMTAGQFMPVVEALGMIRPVDRRVMEMAVDELTRVPHAELAINVSGLTTANRAWLRSAVSLLRGKPEIAERIIVEITETAGLEDLEACSRFVSTLRDLGCRIALDDFGAGYTSFRHLKKLPVNIVKIDGSFIRNLNQSEDNLVFVRTLLDLARSFNLTTVAECVETMDEVRILRQEGVHLLQGYALGMPDLAAPWDDAAVDGAGTPARTRGANAADGTGG